jgi:hypothetical protein
MIQVENYFGGCPECGACENILNVGPNHWCVIAIKQGGT